MQVHCPVALSQMELVLPLRLQLQRLQPDDENPVYVSRHTSHFSPTMPGLQLRQNRIEAKFHKMPAIHCLDFVGVVEPKFPFSNIIRRVLLILDILRHCT